MKVDIERMINISYTNVELKNILLKKNLSSDDIMYATNKSQELIRLTDGLDARAYIFLGKIKYISKNYKDSRIAFQDAIKINPILPSAYYGLFKLNMDSERYEAALDNIINYQKYSGIDCTFYISLINKKLNKDNIYVNYNEEIQGNKKLPKNILDNYKYAVDAYNAEEYSKCLKHINVCRKLLSIKNIKIDLKYMTDILIKLVEISNNKKRNSDIALLTNSILSTDNCGQKYLSLTKLFEISPNNINVVMLLIEICLELRDLEQASMYLDVAKKIDGKLPRVRYYEQVINEVTNHITEYPGSITINFRIDTFMEEGKLKEALELSTKSFDETNDTYLLYKSAVILFKIGKFEESEKLFLKYLSLSSINQKEVFYFLYYINLYNDNHEMRDYCLKATYELSKFEGNFVTEEEWIEMLSEYSENFDEKDIRYIDKKLLINELQEKQKVKIKQAE